MAEPNSVVALSILVSCAGLVAVGLMFRSYQIDKFREKIFSLREEMFLYSFDEGIVEGLAYRSFRHRLNSLLRYAHKVTFLHMVVLVVATRVLKVPMSLEVSPVADWQAAVEQLPDAQKEKFNSFNKKTVGLVVKHVIFNSVLFWPFAVVAVIAFVVQGQVVASAGLVKAVRALIPINLFEAEALRASPPQSAVAEY